ncbi:MAG: chemotaxis protein CheW [Gammaproteobacteria bacterium]|nr:chemotaxis protein CheW [Gammaproteobacteria bacterium]
MPLTATGDELVSHGDASLLPLRLGSTWIGIATEQVHLISQIAEVHRVPFRSNECVLGVVAVQGEVMPCISLSALLGVARDEKNQRRNTPGRYERMVVLNYGTLRVATAVDEVRDVTHFYFKELQEKVECSEAVRHFIKGELRVSQRGESYAIYKLDMTLLEQRIRKELA